MATGIEANILEALSARMAALVLSSPLPVSWANVDYVPITGTGYITTQQLPNQTMQASLGTTGKNRHRGIFQISVFWPKGKGQVTPLGTVGEIITHFKRGTVLTAGGISVRIDAPPYANPAMVDGAFFMTPISVPYVAETDNP